MGVLWGENIVQESSRLPRFSLRLNPEPEVSPPWHSRPEDDRGDGAGAPPHREGSLSRLCPPENCYASLTLRMSGHYRKPSTDNGILGKDEPKMFYRTLVDAWGRLITDSSRLTSSREHLCVCDTFQIMHKVGEKYHNAVLEVKGYKVISETGDYLPPR